MYGPYVLQTSVVQYMYTLSKSEEDIMHRRRVLLKNISVVNRHQMHPSMSRRIPSYPTQNASKPNHSALDGPSGCKTTLKLRVRRETGLAAEQKTLSSAIMPKKCKASAEWDRDSRRLHPLRQGMSLFLLKAAMAFLPADLAESAEFLPHPRITLRAVRVAHMRADRRRHGTVMRRATVAATVVCHASIP